MEDNHIVVARLFDAATAGLKLQPSEKAHLVICNECKEIIATFARQFSRDKGVIIFPSDRKAG